MTAELGPFSTQRDDWAYRAQVDDEQNELVCPPVPLALTTDAPNALAIGIAITVVSAMVLVIALIILASGGWLS